MMNACAQQGSQAQKVGRAQKAMKGQLESLERQVRLERLGHQAFQVRMGHQGNKVPLVRMARKEPQEKTVQLGRMESMDPVVHQDYLERKAQLVLPVRSVLMVRQVCKDHRALQVFLGRMGRWGPQVLLASQGQQVLKENLAKLASLVNKVMMVQLGRQGLQERKERLEMWAVLEPPEHPDHLAQTAQRASLVHQAPVECLVQMEKLDQQDHLVKLVQMAHQVLMVLMVRLDVQEFLDHPVRMEKWALQVRRAHHRLQDRLDCQGCKDLQDHRLTQRKLSRPRKPSRLTLEKYSTSPR